MDTMSVSVNPLPLPSPLSASPGAWLNVEDMMAKYVRVKAGAACTIQIEGALDDQTDPIALGAATVNTSAWISIPDTVKYIRANLTAYASGSPTAILAGKLG